MYNMKEYSDGAKYPENHSDSDQRVGPEGEAIVALCRRVKDIVYGGL